MPILRIDERGIADAVAALRSGIPLVIPAPSPLPYVITGTDAASVNAAKKRPADQPVGVSVADLDILAPHLDIDAETLPLARWLCEVELVSLLLPVRDGAPSWLAPAISEGMMFFSATPWLPALRSIITTFGYLYMTSANLTGGQPAVTAAQAQRALAELPVLDGDPLRDQELPHGSTTMVRVGRSGALTVARSGINNHRFGTDLTGYVDDVSRRWRERRPAS